MEDLGNMTISYSDSTSSGSGEATFSNGTIFDYGWYHDIWYPWYVYTYPNYTHVEKDAFERAFKVAKMLLAKKLLKSGKVKDFIELIELIADEMK